MAPLGESVVNAGDIVLWRAVLHLLKAVQGDRFQIDNNRGGINGWVTLRQIFGRLVRVDP